MALEELQIHSKSFLVRWVDVAAGHTISWNIQPHKKSLNFGIFKHPSRTSDVHVSPSPSTAEGQAVPGMTSTNTALSSKASSVRSDGTSASKRLLSIGLQPMVPMTRCEGDQLTRGTYDVPAEKGGMYALLFDNTFSKQISKTVSFVLLTYPIGSAPQTTHLLHHRWASSSAATSQSSLGVHPPLSPRPGGIVTTESTESLHTNGTDHVVIPRFKGHLPISGQATMKRETSPDFYTGVLHKRRRKRHQGFARRFFSLDYTSSTLSYYHNRRSSALRGAIPLALAIVGMNARRREISVDSGAEVWHLRASNVKDFESWKSAFERALRSAARPATTIPAILLDKSGFSEPQRTDADDTEWSKIETLVARVAGIRDAVRRLTATTDHSRPPSQIGPESVASSVASSPVQTMGADYFQDREKRPFWRRTSSSTTKIPDVLQRSSSRKLAVPMPVLTPSSPGRVGAPSPHRTDGVAMHEHCLALLQDLDAVVADFTITIQESKGRRQPILHPAVSRHSIDSATTADFFDAEEVGNATVLLIPDPDLNDTPLSSDDEFTDAEYDSNSETGSPDGDFDSISIAASNTNSVQMALFPLQPKNLAPLPLAPVKRRGTVPPSTTPPPSLIGFLRKNIGKDLSTISMPVSANEPTSLLQRIAEQLEYCALLDATSRFSPDSVDRLLCITAFAISSFANNRVKERSIRKPFNPLLGETFELVREDHGFRFLAEKVSHRPVRMACQAESTDWTFTQSPMPTQKFSGKSAELNTDGRARVVLHPPSDSATGRQALATSTQREYYSWTSATCFLRNLIAGEKYVEPVGTMTVVNERSGSRAVVTFQTKGMFSGRSEDIVVQTFSPDGVELPHGLVGKWTSSLSTTSHGKPEREIWSAGSVVEGAQTRYGMTTFAAGLNEITDIEAGHIPPTDSRLRPDQRAAEEGDLDCAEVLKGSLEEMQRLRKAKRDEEGLEYVPRWFERVEHVSEKSISREGGQDPNEEVWRMKTGSEGYWDVRERGNWDGVGVGKELFDVHV